MFSVSLFCFTFWVYSYELDKIAFSLNLESSLSVHCIPDGFGRLVVVGAGGCLMCGLARRGFRAGCLVWACIVLSVARLGLGRAALCVSDCPTSSKLSLDGAVPCVQQRPLVP